MTVILAIVIAATATIVPVVDNGSAAVVRVEEDTPAWNCHTMGNRICGPNA